MPTPEQLEQQFWSAVTSDMTMMLGLNGTEGVYPRPMTALVEDEHQPFWFFTARDTDLVQGLAQGNTATATFTSKGHDLFATIHGRLVIDNDRNVIDRLWNSYIAAWYEKGKDDPKLVLLRLDADHAHIWQNATSLFAGIKLMLGADPKTEYKDKTATIPLN